MATVRWIGGARKTAQVRSGTITAYDAASTYKITIGNRVISTVGTGGTANTTAVALVALLNASALQEFAEITWTAPGSGVITGTADVAGKFFTFTLTVTGGTGTVTAAADTTANSGPNDLKVTENYDTGALPGNGDTLEFADTGDDVLYNLDALSAVTLAVLRVRASFTGTKTGTSGVGGKHGWIGLPPINIDDTSNPYAEYRQRQMKVGATVVDIGYGSGNGSGRLYFDFQAVQFAATINFAAAPPADTANQEAVQITGTHASNTLDVKSGSVGVAINPGDTSTLLTTKIGGNGDFRAGSGVTLNGGSATFEHASSGKSRIQSAMTTLTQKAGIVQLDGSGVIATYDLLGGIGDIRSTGTITTLNIATGAQADFRYNQDGITLGTVYLNTGAGFNDPNKKTTRTNGFNFFKCGRHQCNIDTGQHYREPAQTNYA